MISSKPRDHRMDGEEKCEGQVAGHGETHRHIRYCHDRPAAGGGGWQSLSRPITKGG